MSDVITVTDDVVLVDLPAEVSVVETGNDVVVTSPPAEVQVVVEKTTADIIFSEQDADPTIITEGAQGPQGPVGETLEFPFSFGDATPATVTTARAGKLVYAVQLHIRTPFDGAGAALVVGDAGQADRLMKSSENDPVNSGSSTTAPAHTYGVDTPVLLGITPGAGATKGAGVLVLNIQR